jgi:hypothetical protein
MHSAYGTRLLSIGEIFDRAVHLTIAKLVPLAAIVGVVNVPTRAIADWIDRDGLARYFVVDGKIVADPRLLADYFALMRDPNAHLFNWPDQIWFMVSLFPMALSFAAASIASREFLNGDKTTLGAAYRIAFRRLAPVIGANILSFALYLAAFAVAIAVLLILFLVLKAAGGATDSAVVGISTMSLVGLMILWIAPLSNCTTTGAALYAIRPVRALREAWAMTMTRGLRWRSLALGAALLAVTAVQEIMRTVLCGFLSDVTHAPWLSFVASDAITLLALIIVMALAVVFYLDARNRAGLIQDPLAGQENSQAR